MKDKLSFVSGKIRSTSQFLDKTKHMNVYTRVQEHRWSQPGVPIGLSRCFRELQGGYLRELQSALHSIGCSMGTNELSGRVGLDARLP